MKNVKRLLSFLLTAAMLLSLLPTFALANETEQIQWTDVSTAEQLTEIMTKGGNAKLTANITIAAVKIAICPFRAGKFFKFSVIIFWN
jgi:hypothetical protein